MYVQLMSKMSQSLLQGFSPHAPNKHLIFTDVLLYLRFSTEALAYSYKQRSRTMQKATINYPKRESTND